MSRWVCARHVAATAVSLQGAGATFLLSNPSNSISTLEANAGSINVQDNATALTVRSVNAISGVTTSGSTSLANSGSISFSNALAAGGHATVNNLNGNILVNSGATLRSSASGNALVVAASAGSSAGTAGGGDFINNEGSDALVTLASGAYWTVFNGDLSGAGTTLGGLSLGNWRYNTDTTYGSGNSISSVYYRASPILILTALAQSSQYGASPLLAQNAFTVGGEAAGNGSSADTGAAALGGAPTLSTTATSLSSVGGGPYVIAIAAANILNPYNYQISYVSGALTVTPAPLTISADNKSIT